MNKAVGKIYARYCGKEDNTIIAHLPAGILTTERFDKILAAYIHKGSALTLEEVMPFYQESEK